MRHETVRWTSGTPGPLEEENKRLREALEEIADMKPITYKGMARRAGYALHALEPDNGEKVQQEVDMAAHERQRVIERIDYQPDSECNCEHGFYYNEDCPVHCGKGDPGQPDCDHKTLFADNTCEECGEKPDSGGCKCPYYNPDCPKCCKEQPEELRKAYCWKCKRYIEYSGIDPKVVYYGHIQDCDGNPEQPEEPTLWAKQLHEWYLEATSKLNPNSYNQDAQKEFDDLTAEQKFIDEYIADKIRSRILADLSELEVEESSPEMEREEGMEYSNGFNAAARHINEKIKELKKRWVEP